MIKSKVDDSIKIQLGSGILYKEGYVNVDIDKSVKADVYHDLDVYPYPFKDNSASIIVAKHIIEHLSNQMAFMQECYRILKPNGKLFIECPIGGTWASYHLNHKHNLTPWSFFIFKQKRWTFQIPFTFYIDRMVIFMPWIQDRIAFPWRLIYLNCFVNNIFTKMKVELKKEGNGYEHNHKMDWRTRHVMK